jgi:hypothetical protein
MKKIYPFFSLLLLLFFSCSKESVTPIQTETKKTFTAETIYNPIVGNWELGVFKILCGVDTTIYPNEIGDFVEFGKSDTAFYTYNSTNATGWSPYSIIDSSTFVLNGDTMHIISYDGTYLTTYNKASDAATKEWMTYKKAKTNN